MTGERTEATGLHAQEATTETGQAEATAPEATTAPAPQDMAGDDAFDENASFADLLEAHSGAAETVRTGERVKATVVAIGEDTVFVATGAKVDALDCLALAEQAGSSKAVNIVLMGRLSHYFDLPEEAWQASLEAMVPPKFLELNKKAFELGKNA